jgi:hypothetical protein
MWQEVERAVGAGHETIEADADENGCFHGAPSFRHTAPEPGQAAKRQRLE